MDHPRDELLPGAALAGDQDRRARRRHPSDEVEDPSGRRRIADEQPPRRRSTRLVQKPSVLFLETLDPFDFSIAEGRVHAGSNLQPGAGFNGRIEVVLSHIVAPAWLGQF